MLRDQLIKKVYAPAVRETFPGTIPLDYAITLALSGGACPMTGGAAVHRVVQQKLLFLDNL